MSILSVRRKRTRQPRTFVKTAKCFADFGIVDGWNFIESAPYGIISNKQLPIKSGFSIGTVSYNASNNLCSIGVTNKSGGKSAYVSGIDVNSYPNGTVIFVYKPGSAYNENTVVETVFGQFNETSLTIPEFTFQKYTNGNIYAGWNRSGADDRVIIAASQDIWDTSNYAVYCLAYQSSGSTRLYRNGKLIAENGGTTTVGGATGTSITILDWLPSSSGAVTGNMGFFAFSKKSLSAVEIQHLSQNMWAIFVSVRSISFFDASAASDLSASAQASVTATGTITSSVAMAGASVVIASATGAVNQTVGLSGAAASASVADGVVSITTSLAGDGFVESFASGALASALALEASAQAAATAAGDLSTDADLAGTAVAQAAATGSIGLSVSLSADSLIQAMASANLDSGAANDLSGNAAAIATATGGIMQDVPVLGSATITVTGAGGLSSTLQLEGAAAVSALAGGDLQVSALGLSANAIIQALAGGSIEMTMSLSADALAQALAVGTLTVGDLWSGAFIEKYTALAPARNYTATAPERNYTATA